MPPLNHVSIPKTMTLDERTMAKISQRYDSHIEGYNKITEKSNEETTGNIESCRVLTIDSIKDISKGNATA